jgi:assimilatory nitrate reductase catalytic subunit
VTDSSTNPWIKSTCAYCGVGCGIEAQEQDDGSLAIRGDSDHPANYGRLCSKGLALGETVIEEGRLLKPVIDGREVDWNTALDHVADGFANTIKKHGPDSVAFYVSGQLLTEDYYVANKLMKGYFGSANIDTNSRLCMSSSVAGHKRAFGSDTVPNCYEDFELSDLIVLVGSNLAWCHPVLYQRIKAAKEKRPDVKIIVIDPRQTDSCEIADLHLALQPGADVPLFTGLLNYLAEHNHLNEEYITAHTNGFAEALSAAKKDTGETGVDYALCSQLTGIPIAYLETFYQWFANTEKVLTIYSQGVNQSSAGVDKVNSIINCHLATGRIGKEGCGPFSITGQPNAMGGREVGGLANMLAAHMEFGNDEHIDTVKSFWQVEDIATKPGLKAIDMFDAIDSGKIKAVWIMATNPVVSLPNAEKIKSALKKCPLVVVSDCIAETDTTAFANVLLPAKGWAEKSGTVTNSERRISRQRSLIASSGEAQSDWWIMSQVALRMGFAGFNFTCEADIFREYAAMTGANNNGQRDLDISVLADINNKDYNQLYPQQWPLTALDTSVTQKRFFANGGFFTPNAKANFIALNYRRPRSQVNTQFPMVLNTGRIRDQWHTMTRTALVPKLNAHIPEPYVQIHPQDARCFGLKEGNIAQLKSEWGEAKARVLISNDVTLGQCFMPMHWTGVNSSEGRVCTLISPDVDPISGQPESKFSPVALQQWAYISEALFLSQFEINTDNFEYWVKRKVDGGFLYYLATTSKEESLLDQLQTLPLFKDSGNSITFDNPNSGSYRTAKVVNGKLIAALIIDSKIKADDYAWLDTLFTREMDTDIQRSILSGVAADSLITGKQVCACKQVGELTIKDAVIQGGCHTVEAVGASTAAGTGCGSCIPEIKQLIEANENVVAIAV